MSGFLYRILPSTGSRTIGMKNTWLSIGWVIIQQWRKKSIHIRYNFHKIIVSILWKGIRLRDFFLFSIFWSDCITNTSLKKKLRSLCPGCDHKCSFPLFLRNIQRSFTLREFRTWTVPFSTSICLSTSAMFVCDFYR